MSQITGADKNAETIFKQTTEDETQSLKDKPKFSVIYKGHMTRSTILETKYPGDSGAQELTVDGPGDNFIIMDSLSRINIRTGPRNPAIGAGSGALNINAGGGGIWKFEERLNMELNMGGDNKDKQALNMHVNGNMVVDASGDGVVVRGHDITIIAGNMLTLKGMQVNIDANNGAGAINMFGGIVQTVTDTKNDFVMGQAKLRNFGEITDVQYDPRGTSNIISMGHINRKVLGDYELWSAGVMSYKAAGALKMIPLIYDRTNTFKISTAVGNVRVDSKGAFLVDAGFEAEVKSKLDASLEATAGSVKVKAKQSATVEGGEGLDLKALANDILIDAKSKVTIKGQTEVAIDSANIYLN